MQQWFYSSSMRAVLWCYCRHLYLSFDYASFRSISYGASSQGLPVSCLTDTEILPWCSYSERWGRRWDGIDVNGAVSARCCRFTRLSKLPCWRFLRYFRLNCRGIWVHNAAIMASFSSKTSSWASIRSHFCFQNCFNFWAPYLADDSVWYCYYQVMLPLPLTGWLRS